MGLGVVLSGASTRWPGAEPVRLEDIDVPAGRRLAILGDDRAGMSTLAALLLRILDYRGSIALGGAELRELTGDEVRRSVAHCGQYAPVIDGTVADNVRIARPGASQGEVRAVLRRTGLAHWADMRAAAPGPPVLRIALARALLADVPVLIVDEPVLVLDEPVLIVDEPEPARPDGEEPDDLLIDLLTAATGRTVLLTTRRAALPGADPVLRHVDFVIGDTVLGDTLLGDALTAQ